MTTPIPFPTDSKPRNRAGKSTGFQVAATRRFIRLNSGKPVNSDVVNLLVAAADDAVDNGTSDLVGDVRRRFVGLSKEEIVEILFKSGRQARRETAALKVAVMNALEIARDAACDAWSVEAA